MAKWDPHVQPYRLTETCQSSAPGCYGWVTRVHMFATQAELEAAVAAPMKAGVFHHEGDKCRLSPDGVLVGWDFIVARKRVRKTRRVA